MLIHIMIMIMMLLIMTTTTWLYDDSHNDNDNDAHDDHASKQWKETILTSSRQHNTNRVRLQ